MKSCLEENFKKFTSVGMDELGGVNRVFGTENYKTAARMMKEYLDSLGLYSYIDSAWNVHGIYKKSEDKPEVMMGSHLDTVVSGGKFDGLTGVLGGIEVIRRIMEEKVDLPFALHLVATNGEEGNDLGGTFGSRCMTGLVNYNDEAYIRKAKTFGFSREDIKNAGYDFSHTLCYLELHIEQGLTLDKSHEDIGVVNGIVGLQRYQIEVSGAANHAGTTLMEYRDDALVKAAELITYADALARKYPDQFVTTFTKVAVDPNITAIINGHVSMVLECRSIHEDLMEQFVAEVRKKADDLGGITLSPIVSKSPVKCADTVIRAAVKASESAGVKFRVMTSGATHDGNSIATKIPIGMIFVPSKDGKSHVREEYTSIEQCECGVNILYHTILNLADDFRQGILPAGENAAIA